ncbi:MAG: AAA family ATPase [Verrucomicrobia bacterium]|nr:AAA family ATPase [Verrucomicrobiota bacterium]
MPSPAEALPDPWPDGPGTLLADHIQCAAEWRPLLDRRLRYVRVVDALPPPGAAIPEHAVLVTPSGAVRRGNGLMEYWMAEAHEITPLARRECLEGWTRELADLRRRHEEGEQLAARLRDELAAGEPELADLRKQLEDSRHRLAQREGEHHIIAQEADQARQRAETVTWEWQSLQDQTSSGAERKNAIHAELDRHRTRQAEIRGSIAARNDELRALENERAEKSDIVTNARVVFAERRQAAEHMAERQLPLQSRIQEIEQLVRTRSEDLGSYRARIGDLQRQVSETRQRLEPLEQDVARQAGHLEAARREREEAMGAVGRWDSRLHEQRAALDDLRTRKGQVDVELAEQRVRRQNLVERVTADYRVTPEQLAAAPEPAWENGQRPDRDTLETQIAELRARLESMGPVNLVAIEEYNQYEERAAFLTRQQEDLINAKQQLLDLIRRINQTTTEMFSQTFNQVNANFQDMFQKLFGGGTAKLVLVDEGDVLESGIEIIARPPGKKLQTVSLLSGGERTMTAVALLFALYMVKPSPFCLLDELDAALDEANIGRFIKVVEGFVEKSQFIVITHNRQTIGAADILYGVTMEHQGVSKIVSMKFSRHEQQPAPAS